MKKDDIKKIRCEIGKYLHSYYIRYGEKRYYEFLKQLSPALEEYGDSFSENNLRIMEAEYVYLNSKIGVNNKSKTEKAITSK